MPRKSLHSSINNLSYKSLLIILFFLLISIVVLWKFVLPNHKVEASWWNDGWNYRKAIPVTNTLGSTVNNQIVKIIIDTSALVTAGKLQSDCDDIRITDINGNLLDHWDTGCNTTTTNIYFKLSSIPTSGTTTYFYYGNVSAINDEKKLGTAETPGTSCQMMKDQGSVTTNGTYYIVPGGNSVDKQFVYCDQTTDGGGWALVMNQKSDTGGFFANSTEAQSYNESNPTADRYSILGKLSKFKDNGIFTFKLNWPPLGSTRNIWSQTSNPISESIAGYTAIDVNQTVNYWGGIALSSSASTFIDGSPSNGTWYYAIASYTIYIGGIPAYSPVSTQTQLWVKGNNTMNNVSVGTPSTEEAGGGPIAYWKFDEGSGTTAYDSSSNSHTGTLQNGTSWASENQCVSGKCLKFDGVDDYVSAGTGTNYLPLDNFSMCAWVKSPGLASGMTVNGIMSFTYGLSMSLDSSGQFRSLIDNGSNLITVTVSGNLYDNKFHYLCTTFDGTNRYMYVDGKLKNSTATTWNNRYTSNTVNIGHENNNPPVYKFNGFIDEPKIYRYARTADQIKKDYNSRGASSQGTSANLGSAGSDNNLSEGLVGYWKMDEGVGTSIIDSSGNNNTGTMTNIGWVNGKYGIGTSYNGTNNVILVADTNNSLDLPNDFTISFWANPDSSGSKELIAKPAGGNYEIWQSSTSLAIRINGSNPVITASNIFTYGQWTHVVVKYERTSGIVTIYKNGSYSSSGTNTNSASINNSSLQIGAYSDGTSYPFSGIMDEIRIYNRALSPAEVFQLYEYAPGPIGYWDLNEASGTTIKDKSGNNLNGTFGIGSSAPSWSSGKYGGGVDFSPTTKFINIPANSLFQTNTSGRSFSYSLWFKSKNVSASSQYLITNNEPCNNPGSFSIKLSSGVISFNYYSLSLPGSVSHSFTPSITLQNNTWYHLEWTKTFGQLGVKAYLNGIPQTISGDSTATGNTTSRILLGAWNGTGSTCTGGVTDSPPVANMSLNGSIDDVKIYNYIRTQKQIIEDMNASHPAVSANSAIAYYKFDEGYGTSVIDWGLGKNNGTFTGSTLPTWSNNGKFNKAVNFDNTTGSITMGDPTNEALDPGTNDFTISYWIKTNPSSTWILPIYKGGSSINTIGYDFELSSATHKLNFNLADSNSHYYTVTTSSSIDDNNWHHIVGVVDRSGALGTPQKSHLFVDGKEEGTPVNISLLESLSNSYPFDISKSGYTIKGLIDDVKIYKYALTAEDIKQDYNQNSALQMGQTSQTIGGTTTSLEYCIPGDTSYCASPVAEWKLDEGSGTSAKDTSGNNNTGTLGTGNSAPSWTQGKTGSALSFNGSSNYIGIPYSSSLAPSAITFEAWAYKPSWTDAESSRILSKTETGGYTLLYSSGSIYSYIYRNGAYSTPSASTSGLSPGWHYFTGSYDGRYNKIYIDGVLKNTDDAGANYPITYSYNNSLIIGAEAGSGTSPAGTHFTGKIDQIRIYDYARTPAQIAYDYNKGGPVGWWKFDECQGNIAYDWSGVGNTGTIIIGASGTQNSLGTCSVGTSAAWTNGATGKLNSSLNFDGTDDYISIPNNSTLNITGEMSISLWVKPESNSSCDGLVDKSSGGSGSQAPYLFWRCGQTFNFYRGNGSSYDTLITVKNYPANNWYHITIVSGNNNKIYINGILDNTASKNLTYTGNTNPLLIGAMPNNPFPGQIDDVRIYNYALTSEQVKTLYNNGAVSFN